MKLRPLLFILSVGLLVQHVKAASTPADNPHCPVILVTGTAASCYGLTDGTAMVSISGASGSYSILWSNGVQMNTINGLGAGTYTVSVKDNASGCVVNGAYVVEAPEPIRVDADITHVKCKSGSTGAVQINTTGGNGSYTYQWQSGGSPVATSANISGVNAGLYSFTLRDARGCQYTQNYVITEPVQPVSVSYAVKHVDCYSGATGAIDVDVWGGTPGYTYAWSNGQISKDVNNLTQGIYSITVTDFNNCTLNVPVTVQEPTQLTGTISAVDVLCHGESTGEVSVSATGGTLPYSYSWKNSTNVFGLNTPALNGVSADNYEVSVTDGKGCRMVRQVLVDEPSPIILSHTFTDISCYGGSDGRIQLTVLGGVPAYAYEWKNNAGGVVSTLQNLNAVEANTYTVTITDQNGCQKFLTQQLSEPLNPVAVAEDVLHVKCFGENTGRIGLGVTGGTAPYMYSWSNGQNTSEVDNLLANAYAYTVTDSKGCPFSSTVTITQPLQPLTATYIVTDVNCFGEANGRVDLTAAGGTVPYRYAWENSTYNLSGTGSTLVDFPADVYRYAITDHNDCKIDGFATIAQPALLQSSISGVNILCNGGNNGSINLPVWGGVQPYVYTWSNGTTTQNQNLLTAGTYTVTVADAHNCVTSNAITLTEPNEALSYVYKTTMPKCNNGQDGKIELAVKGGTSPYQYIWSNGSTETFAQDLSAGLHNFLATDANGCTISDTVLVTQPDALVLNEQVTPVSCYGFSDGDIIVAPVGGTAPYHFTWLNSSYVLATQTQNLIGFPSDLYQVEILDSNNCFTELFINIPQPDVISVSYTTDIVSCHGYGDGNIYVEIKGGAPAYNTQWNTGATTQNLLNIQAGVYNLWVVDQNGCEDSIVVDITEPLKIDVTAQVTEVTCIDQHDGTATAFAEGGNGGFLFNWSEGTAGYYAENLSSQYYTVTVVDILGCTGETTVFVPKSDVKCVEPVTAFTPNGDNYNDTWIIDNLYLYPDMDLSIFNRWGNLLYRNKGSYKPWDGTVNGRDCPADVYYYIINLNTENRDPLTGNITIIR